MTEQGESKSGGKGGSQRQSRQQSTSPLQTDRGNTTIQDSVVSAVAGLAAQEVEGLQMGGGGSQAVSGILGGITGGSRSAQTQGVSTEVGQQEVAVDLVLTVEYGKSVTQIAEAVRNNVINRVENLVGLKVNEVNIDVTNIYFPQQEQQGQRELGGEQTRSSA